jgi:general transcription factor 3C polypeptide 5 (transcription factor C subunit 1)
MATVAYVIGAGPFWKCYCRYGYDPCADPNARQYQRIYFYLRVARTKQQDGVDTLEELGPEEEEEVLDKGMTLNKQHRQKWQEAQIERVNRGERAPIDPRCVCAERG